MPAPATATYSNQAKIDAHTAFLALVDAGTGPANIKFYTEADALLCTAPLTDPAGTVNGTTGQLTFTMGATPNASASGTCTYATIASGPGTVCLTIPAQAGTVAVSGKIVVNSLTFVSGTPVQVVSAVIG